MADGEVTPEVRPLRPAAPGFAGPLAESGAAPPAGEIESPRSAAPAPVAREKATDIPAQAQPDDPQSTTGSPPVEPPSAAEETPPAAPVEDSGPDGEPDQTDAEKTDPGETDAEKTDPNQTDAEKDGGDETDAEKTDAEKDTVAEQPPSPRRRRFRVPFGRARRIPGPRQLAVRSARAVHAWSRRPGGRVALPGGLVLLLVAGAATAGAVLVPAAAPAPRTSPTATASGPGQDTPPPTGPGLEPPLATPPVGNPTGMVPPAGPVGGRPADVLAGWAQQTGARVEIPAVAMQAYGYAELVLAQTKPTCQLTWTTLAAIGLVESAHGSANDAVLGPDGQAVPHIIGLPLDGKGDRQRITDTDGGQLDGDTTYDRAVGPMQFIPTTWRENGVDADNDGAENPHDIDDAALAAGNYLCANGRNLSSAEDWWNAILSYNDVRPYAQAVFDAADRYGAGSRA